MNYSTDGRQIYSSPSQDVHYHHQPNPAHGQAIVGPNQRSSDPQRNPPTGYPPPMSHSFPTTFHVSWRLGAPPPKRIPIVPNNREVSRRVSETYLAHSLMRHHLLGRYTSLSLPPFQTRPTDDTLIQSIRSQRLASSKVRVWRPREARLIHG